MWRLHSILRKNRKQLLALLALLAIFSFGGTHYVQALELTVTGNGSESVNEVAVATTTTTTVEQSNEANVTNNVATDANTGGNTASGNTGGEIAIDTGNITENVSVETAANASVVEVPCCNNEETTVEISGNGADSENSVDLTVGQETTIVIDQKADVENVVNGVAVTGENTANDNVGNVAIETGDIHVSGGIQNGPINFYDVSVLAGGSGFLVKISDNGAESQNKITLSIFDPTNVFINSEADLDNFVNWDLNTGGNVANGNNGDVSIKTGDIFFDFLIKNGPINFGGVEIPCCHLPPLPPTPPTPPPPGDGGNGGIPPAQVTSKPSDPGSSGSISSSAASTEAGGPWVAGLSDTSSAAAQTLFFFAGLMMIAYGAKLIGKEAKDAFK